MNRASGLPTSWVRIVHHIVHLNEEGCQRIPALSSTGRQKRVLQAGHDARRVCHEMQGLLHPLHVAQSVLGLRTQVITAAAGSA